MKTRQTNRRQFLLTAGLGGAGVAAATVAATRKPKPAGAKADAAGQARGYHVSEHILKYYKTTEV